MSAWTAYDQIYHLLDEHLEQQFDTSSRERITLLVLGIIRSESASPARLKPFLKWV